MNGTGCSDVMKMMSHKNVVVIYRYIKRRVTPNWEIFKKILSQAWYSQTLFQYTTSGIVSEVNKVMLVQHTIVAT